MIGDRVKFKKTLPKLEHNVGWKLKTDLDFPDHEHTHGCEHMDPVTKTWSEHFGGLSGVIVNEDVTNDIVAVRGYDSYGEEFYLWIDPQHLNITKSAMDFSDG